MTQPHRIGLGIDLHRMVPGRPCRLGGILIPHDRGPHGHSDGDAILHAVSDACLGAAGLDDLGTLFADSDPRWAGADSATLADEVRNQVTRAGYRLLSIDVVVEAEAPRIGPHRAAIRKRLAELFGCPIAAVNVKGKSAEGLGDIGRGEAIRVTAVALLTAAP
jgi:2-C-methyl-D-erythritol 2,4-cyclodiphosphate synthase